MRMDLIQPFIGSLDAVLGEMMHAPANIAGLAMEEEGYRKKGLAAVVTFQGQIEGRMVLDMEPQAAAQVAKVLAGDEAEAEAALLTETVCELANMVLGNAVTQLNDRGFQFKVSPPAFLSEEECAKTGHDTEATLLRFETPSGNVHLNIAMRYHNRRVREAASRPTPAGSDVASRS